MVQYAPRDLTASTKSVPGTSRMYRLPTMMPGEFHITATGYSAPVITAAMVDTTAIGQTATGTVAVAELRNTAEAAAAPAPASTPAAAPTAPAGTVVAGAASAGAAPPAKIALAVNQTGLDTGLGQQIGINPIGPGGPGGPGGPIIPPSYPVSLDIFHGDQLVVSGAPPPIQQALDDNDGTWRVRVNYAAQSQPTDTIQFSLMPYTSTLPLLTRRIPLWFLQQGFDNNWNGRNYISIAFEDGTLYIQFDPEIASYYHLPNQNIAVASAITEVPPNLVVTDIQLRVDSSSGGYEELAGPLPYIQVTVTVGGIDGQPMNCSILGGDFTIADFSVIVKFYIIAASGVVEGALSTVVGYRSQVTTDLLDKISATNKVGDVESWIASGKVNSYFYNTVLPTLQNYLDSHSAVVGPAITPWLLGAAFTVWTVQYDPTNSQSLPASSAAHPWIPQGDIVVTYLGLTEPPGPTVLGMRPTSTALAIATVAPDGVTGTNYALPLGASGGTAPYTWSVTGTLPAGVTLAGVTLTGVPTTQGVSTFQLKVVDATGASAAQGFTVAVNGPGFSISTASPLPGTAVGDSYAVVFSATGGAGGLKWSATGLPSGLAMSSSGVLSGTPTGDGSAATIIVQAVDANGAIARHAFSLTVLDELLFGEQIYTPRGAGTAIYSPPPVASPLPIGSPVLTAPVTQGNLSKVDHIVVLMMENRSFDHMLGYLSREGGRTDVEGLKWENDSDRTQFNFYNGLFYYPNRLIDTHLFYPESIGPDHSFESVKAQMLDNMGHFVSDYARNKISDDDPAQLSQVMGYYTGEQLPTYDMLAREFTICDHWFCSHPGPTWPNRFVTLTGDLNRNSYGEPEVDTPSYSDFTPSEATTLFDLLTERNVSWQYFEQRASTMRAYTKYTFDLVNVREYSDPVSGFAAAVLAGLKSVTFVDPLFGDLPAGLDSPQDNDDAPPSDLADGQRFVSQVVTTLFTPASNPNWEKTMLVIVYDEHGGFYDHVQPPEDAVPLTGQYSGKLGPRVPAFVVSAWTPAGAVLKDVFDHTSIAATILNRFCSPHPPVLSPRVSAAKDLRDALSLTEARGQLTPLLGLPTQELPAATNRTVVRTFSAPASNDSFGALLGAIALGLGQGGSQT